jgi:hypothetical protein
VRFTRLLDREPMNGDGAGTRWIVLRCRGGTAGSRYSCTVLMSAIFPLPWQIMQVSIVFSAVLRGW